MKKDQIETEWNRGVAGGQSLLNPTPRHAVALTIARIVSTCTSSPNSMLRQNLCMKKKIESEKNHHCLCNN